MSRLVGLSLTKATRAGGGGARSLEWSAHREPGCKEVSSNACVLSDNGRKLREGGVDLEQKVSPTFCAQRSRRIGDGKDGRLFVELGRNDFQRRPAHRGRVLTVMGGLGGLDTYRYDMFRNLTSSLLMPVLLRSDTKRRRTQEVSALSLATNR